MGQKIQKYIHSRSNNSVQTKKNTLTNMEKLLLQDFSKSVSTSFFFFEGSAFLVSVIPLWLYSQMLSLELELNLFTYVLVVVTLMSTYLLAFAYRATRGLLKHVIARQREASVAFGMTHQSKNQDWLSKELKSEKILWKTNQVADYEASTFAVFYNNSLFLAFVLFFCFYVMRNFPVEVNYSLTLIISSLLVHLISTSKFQ